MKVPVDDTRLLGTWRLIAATSGHLDECPRVAHATVAVSRRRRGQLAFDAHVHSGTRERRIRGLIPQAPRITRFSTWLPGFYWLLSAPFHGHVHLGSSGTVAAAVTPGSMLLNSGTALLARSDLDDTAAHRALTLEATELGLSPTQLREMIWRITVPGTDSRRFEGQIVDAFAPHNLP